MAYPTKKNPIAFGVVSVAFIQDSEVIAEQYEGSLRQNVWDSSEVQSLMATIWKLLFS